MVRDALIAGGTSPEEWLRRAMRAATLREREVCARKGLSHEEPLDRATEAMLWRQLSTVHFERGEYVEAQGASKRALGLGVMLDVFHQDVSRALLAMGDVDGAVDHLRLAVRTGPMQRRGFHLWTLGSVLYASRMFAEAEEVLERAVRWGKENRPLYEAHLALVRIDGGQVVDDVEGVVERLARSRCVRGIGWFVLGMLCLRVGRVQEGERYLRMFVGRVREGREVLGVSLSSEVLMAEAELSRLASSGGAEQGKA